MNQTALSVTDSGKTMQSGASVNKSTSDSGESNGFLTTLGELLQPKSKSAGDAKEAVSDAVKESNKSAAELNGETLKSETPVDLTTSTDSEISEDGEAPAKLEASVDLKASTNSEAAANLEESVDLKVSADLDDLVDVKGNTDANTAEHQGKIVKKERVEGVDVAFNEARTDETSTDEANVMIAMNEGNSLLERLDRSNKALNIEQIQLESDEISPDLVLKSNGASGNVVELKDKMKELGLEDVAVEDLSDEEIVYLSQLSRSNPVAEQAQLSGDKTKLTTKAEQQLPTAPTAVSSSVASAQVAQTNAVDKGMPTPHINLSAAAHAESVAEMNLSQHKAMSSALAAGGSLAALKPTSVKDEKETGLSQQLSSLAASQGAQQVQLKAEAQPVVQSSPLHLSRDVAGEKLADQVQMMMSKNLKNIDIRLDPPELGRMHIRMTMHNDAASVQFTVANPQARDMVEQAMPRLRDMLAQQGVQLSETSVQQQGSGQQQNQYGSANNTNTGGNGRGIVADGDLDHDGNIHLDVNLTSKNDGISYYA